MGIKIQDVAYVRFSAPDLFPTLLERGHREMLSDTYAAELVENRSLILWRPAISLWTLFGPKDRIRTLSTPNQDFKITTQDYDSPKTKQSFARLSEIEDQVRVRQGKRSP
jgi:hypothetical protein